VVAPDDGAALVVARNGSRGSELCRPYTPDCEEPENLTDPTGLVLLVVAVVGLGVVGSFVLRYSADLLGIALLVGAGTLAWSTAREAITQR